MGTSNVMWLFSMAVMVLSKYKSCSPGFHPSAVMPPPKCSVPNVAIQFAVEGLLIIMVEPTFNEAAFSTLQSTALTGTYAFVIFISGAAVRSFFPAIRISVCRSVPAPIIFVPFEPAPNPRITIPEASIFNCPIT